MSFVYHLCFGNYKRTSGCAAPICADVSGIPGLHVDEIHLEMASREFAELELCSEIAQTKIVSVGIIDVKSYYIETVNDVAARVRRCLRYAAPERLWFAPDCGLSQTARWAARTKLANMVAGVQVVKKELGLA